MARTAVSSAAPEGGRRRRAAAEDGNRRTGRDGGNAARSLRIHSALHALDALVDENRRVIVFSQFTSMLDLIRPEFDARGVAYSLLTGDTRDRTAAINDFQDRRTRVFPVGLKAGGGGFNLTAANTVILYDPGGIPPSRITRSTAPIASARTSRFSSIRSSPRERSKRKCRRSRQRSARWPRASSTMTTPRPSP